MNARRDANDRPTCLGASSTNTRLTERLRVDPVTNYLLCEIISSSGNASVVHRIDQNGSPTAYGVSSIDGKTLIPLATDSNGYLLCQAN